MLSYSKYIGPEKGRLFRIDLFENNLGTFSSDASSKLDVLGHDGDSLGVDGAEIGIFEKTNKVGFTGFLEGHDGRALESKIGLEVLGDFTYQTLEGQFSDQQFGALLIASDFSERDGSWTVTMGFFNSPGSWCTLAGSFGGQLFSWGLASG